MTVPRVIAIVTDGAAAPGGHYTQGTLAGGFIHVSGQLPVHPDGTHGTDLGFEAQARLAVGNMLSVVRAGGGDASSIAKVTVYLVGIENWPAFNAVYAAIMGAARPARAIVPVPALHHGYLVEVEATALPL